MRSVKATVGSSPTSGAILKSGCDVIGSICLCERHCFGSNPNFLTNFMKDIEKNIQLIEFKYSIMIRCGDTNKTWGLFSKKSNYGEFEWFYTKEDNAWCSIPRSKPNFWKSIKPLCKPFEECLILGKEHDEMCENSEQF